MKIFHDSKELKGLKPVVATGVFDGVHLGHQELLGNLVSWAKDRNVPSLVISFWPHPQIVFRPEDKNFRLLMSPEEKAHRLSLLGIDYFLILPFDKNFAKVTAEDFVKEVLVDTLEMTGILIGDDHRLGKGGEGDVEMLSGLAEKYSFDLLQQDALCSGNNRVSSTFIRACLMAGDLASANKLLGYPFFIIGKVHQGKQLGQKIGFPTANLECCIPWKQVPQDGVYAVWVEWKGAQFGGMLNIGTRPTVENDGKKSIEVHLFGHDGDLYDEQLTVSFVHRIRDEMRFDTVEDLKNQLYKDRIASKEILELTE